MRKILLFFVAFLSCMSYAHAYTPVTFPVLEVNYDTWFDNREYKSSYTPDQTLFGAKFTPILGLYWEGHSLMTGVDLRLDFGDKQLSQDPEFILYYRYTNGRGFKAYAGIFPRKKLRGDFSRAFVSDSVRFYDSNLEGFLLSYTGCRGEIEVAMDWLSRIGDERREMFQILSSASIWLNDPFYENKFNFYAGYQASMFHHSISYNEDGVTDNILFYPFVGLKFRGESRARGRREDSNKLWARVGWLQAMQRVRKDDSRFKTPNGFQMELEAYSRYGFGVNNVLFIGDNMMPYYDRFGGVLYTGDSFYRKTGDVYNRLEVFWKIPYNYNVYFQVGSVHHYDGNKWGWQQRAVLSIYLNEKNFKFRH